MLDGDAAKDLLLGTFIMILALLMWRATENFWAWAVFWIVGTFYIAMGLIKLFWRR